LGDLKTTPQEDLLTDGEEPTPAPKIFKETCRIDWNKDAIDVHNLVRGLSPYPCAWTELYDASSTETAIYNAKVLETRIIGSAKTDDIAGTVYVGKTLEVACGDGNRIEILKLQPSGKKAMAAADFLRGAHLPENILAR
jgi:methionyl-tRNA formyltransferase